MTTLPAPWGSLSYSDEYALYLRDREAWTRYIAPHYAELLAEPKWAAWAWPQMAEDLKRAVWPLLNDEIRRTVRAMRDAAKQPEAA